MTIKKKLIISSIFFILFFAGAALAVSVGLTSIKIGFQDIKSEAAELAIASDSMRLANEKNAGHLSEVETSMAMASTKLSEATDRLNILTRKTTSLDNDIRDLISDMSAEKEQLDEDGVEVLQFLEDDLVSIQETLRRNAFINIDSANAAMSESTSLLADNTTTIAVVMQSMKGATQAVLNAEKISTSLSNRSDTFQETLGQKQAIVILAAILLTVSLALLSMLLLKVILRPLMITQQVLNTATENNDLTTRLNVGARDEYANISSSFNTFFEKISNILRSVDTASQNVESSAMKTLDIAQNSSSVVEKSNTEIDNIVAAIQQMADAATEVASNAESSATQTDEVTTEIGAGQEVIKKSIEEVFGLSCTIKDTEKLMDKLQSKAKNVQGIMDIIRDIAEQTSLLALNAAIEAARAGDKGRGFAVVADQVRHLAKKAAESTNDIESVIVEIADYSDQTASKMVACRQSSDNAVVEARRAEGALNRINKSVERIAEMTTSIAGAAEEQAVACRDVERGVVDIQNLSTTAVDSAVRSNEVAADLITLSQTLSTKVAELKFGR